MKYSEVPKRIESAHYRVNQSWEYLEEFLDKSMNDRLSKLDINPDFQRGHVWIEEQQVKYVEFKLSGGDGSDIIQTNCAGWMNDFRGPYQLVDGKQRLSAVLRFLRNEIKVFGKFRKEFEGRIPHNCDFVWCVNNLKTEKQVLQWYLEMNSGGTPHTEEELQKVKNMLKLKKS